jgi:hypothetical protein
VASTFGFAALGFARCFTVGFALVLAARWGRVGGAAFVTLPVAMQSCLARPASASQLQHARPQVADYCVSVDTESMARFRNSLGVTPAQRLKAR